MKEKISELDNQKEQRKIKTETNLIYKTEEFKALTRIIDNAEISKKIDPEGIHQDIQLLDKLLERNGYNRKVS